MEVESRSDMLSSFHSFTPPVGLVRKTHSMDHGMKGLKPLSRTNDGMAEICNTKRHTAYPMSTVVPDQLVPLFSTDQIGQQNVLFSSALQTLSVALQTRQMCSCAIVMNALKVEGQRNLTRTTLRMQHWGAFIVSKQGQCQAAVCK